MDDDEKTRREREGASRHLQDVGSGALPDESGAAGGQHRTGAQGIASGVQDGGTKPGGGPGAGLGSLGTGGAGTGGSPTGNVKRGGS
jgi:hypothetical protein